LQYIFLKWLLAFLVGFLTGIIATLINLAVENIAGYKFLVVLKYINTERLDTEQILFVIFNF
jgi:chloride channel 7